MEVSYSMSPEDILAFEEYQYRKYRGLGRGQMFGLVIVLAVGAALVGYLVPGTEPERETRGFNILWAVGIPIAIVGVVLLVTRWVSARNAQVLEREIPGAYGRRSLKLDPEYLIDAGETGDGRTRWSAVKDVTLTPERIFILLVNNTGYVIPRSAFRDQAEAAQFAETAAELWRRHGTSAGS